MNTSMNSQGSEPAHPAQPPADAVDVVKKIRKVGVEKNREGLFFKLTDDQATNLIAGWLREKLKAEEPHMRASALVSARAHYFDEVEKLKSALEEKKEEFRLMGNSVIEACIRLPNVSMYVLQLETANSGQAEQIALLEQRICGHHLCSEGHGWVVNGHPCYLCQHTRIEELTAKCADQVAALRTALAKMKQAGDAIASYFNPGQIPAPEPTEADLAFGHWEYVSTQLTPRNCADAIEFHSKEAAKHKKAAKENVQINKQQADQIAALQRENEQLREDKELLDWLLSEKQFKMGIVNDETEEWIYDRAAIKAARNASEGGATV